MFRRSINYTCKYGLRFLKQQIDKDDIDIFRNNIFSAETDVMFYITSNTSILPASHRTMLYLPI